VFGAFYIFDIMKELMNEIDKRFREALQIKTGWGKDEVYHLYQKITNEVYLEYLANLMDRKQA
jgi:hypothetical protein